MFHPRICGLDPPPKRTNFASNGLVRDKLLAECLSYVRVLVSIMSTASCQTETGTSKPEPLVIKVCRASQFFLFSLFLKRKGAFSSMVAGVSEPILGTY